MTDSPPEMTARPAWSELWRRKVVQWGLGYAAAAWSLLQAIDFLAVTFHWPTAVRPLSTLIAIACFPVALAIAWYHGDRGQQRATRRELAVVALLLVAGGAFVWIVFRNLADDSIAAGEPGAAATAPRPVTYQASVAVLPFKVLSSGADDGYFADGLTEEVINSLATLPDVLVTARTSAFHFKGKDVPIPVIGRELGVAHVVEGSVRWSAGKARITAQLIRASDGFNLWTQTYEYTTGDAFAVQTQIAESVAKSLGVLLDGRRRAAMTEAGVRDVETFVAFERGVDLFNRAHNEGPMLPLLARANEEFSLAIARTPGFAAAHFHHADYYAHFLIDDAPGSGADVRTVDGLTRDEAARQLSADLGASYRHERDPAQRRVVQVLRSTASSDWRRLDEQIRQAFAGWTNCRHGLWIDQTAITFGHGLAALEHDLKRRRCDPLGGNWTREAVTAIWIGRPLDGLKFADYIESKRGPDLDVTYTRVLANLALGRVDEAESLFDAGQFDAPGVPEAMTLLALMVPAAAGRAQEWKRLRPTVADDPGRLLVGAAVFGDRETANRAAAAIDAMTLGPLILLRVTDRCGCGSPFDLSATPNLARQLREGSLRWSPVAPIKYPLKNW